MSVRYISICKEVAYELYKIFDMLVSLDKNVLSIVVQGDKVYLSKEGEKGYELKYKYKGVVTRKTLEPNFISSSIFRKIFSVIPNDKYDNTIRRITFNKAYLYELEDIIRVASYKLCYHINSGNTSVKAPKSEVDFSDLCELRKNYVGVSHLLGG